MPADLADEPTGAATTSDPEGMSACGARPPGPGDGRPLTWLAVDGGQSQIRLRLPNGQEAQGAGVRHHPGGNVPGMLASISAALAELGNPRVRLAALGMSGLFQEPGPLTELGNGIVSATGARRVLMFGDDISNHAGALRGEPGVVAAIGTGTAVIGLNPAGRFTTVDGRGYLLGDDGSGFQLGQHGLRAVLEHAEGLHPPTALTRAAIERYGPVERISAAVYRSPAPAAAVAAFARDVLATARAGDPVAVGIVATSMGALARSIRAAAGGFEARTIPVAVVGGLARAADVLLPVLTEALQRELPAAQIRRPLGNSLDGAAWLAQHDPGPYAPRVHVHLADSTARHRPENAGHPNP